ncbi:hypothetical protein GGP86_000097 [Salinibacter ruber]|uniref:hypothetical protein n=1 Tax=Salinibacter ruber TaxID=146919 RepID=UPI002169360A|nr:hypothetical protein [Salinibacter ruber]MCS3860349.1 hypothetical protein [Salinibacter ruber]
MKYEKSDVVSFAIFIIGILVCIIFAYNIYRSGKGILDVVPVIGSIASSFGFVIAIVQIAKVRSSSEAARRAAQEAKSRVYNYVSLSDISSSIKMLDEVKRYLRDENYIAAEIRMSDLRGKLTKVKDHSSMNYVGKKKELAGIVSDLGMEVTNLNKTIMDRSKSYDRVKVMEKLERAKDIIQQMESRIKFGENVSKR